MRTFICLIFLYFNFVQPSFAQQADNFDIQVTYAKKRSQWLKRKHFSVDPNHIYEDSSFIVSKTCFGEFGGKAIFKDKSTGMQYATMATCAVAINKLNGSYFVTSSLAHLSGSCSVIELKDPRKISLLEEWPPVDDTIKRSDDYYRHLYRNIIRLVDKYDMLAITSFVYNDQLYHIVMERGKGTYVARVENREFVKVATISNDGLYNFYSDVSYTRDKHTIVVFRNAKFRGHYDVYENHINVVRYQKK